ncbi:ankyrin [Aspergillus vadensis CBS 113365]|uniref:Ankyrin n=1 Tax=Aspergillus vadensis (strain CBS 113365 / IMI 142717 / IBT 24658) TaxID=1448311 RepID=A0A319BEY8_ASPVC|nr:ankyrin [Aspergillus vadensis CBS 113365]PYH64493.1 ankyrin [Aspergillus vadensis CBS 113365]
MENIGEKLQKEKEVSEAAIEKKRKENSSRALEKFHCTLGDRFERDSETYSHTKDEFGMTPLHYAAQLLPTEHWQEREKWNSLLKGLKLDDLNEQDEDGRTPMSHAAELGNAWAVNKLIKAGADPYRRDKNGRSALSWAAQFGHKELIELLSWDVGFSDDKDNQGWTPCHYFLQCSLQSEPHSTKDYDLRILPLIWDRSHSLENSLSGIRTWTRVPSNYMSASILSEHDAFGLTLLARAVQLERNLIVRILLTIKDINISVADRDGKTPLWRAIEARHREIAEILWSDDDVTLRLLARNAHTRSEPLEWLITNGYPLLRRHGSSEETAFHIMLDIPNIGVMEHYLQQIIVAQVPELTTDTVEAPTKLSSKFLDQNNRRGLTPLALAKEKGLLSIVKLFLRWRARVDCFEHKADWLNLLSDSKNKGSFCKLEETYRDVSLELVRKKNNILIFDSYQAEDVTPQGRLVERCDMLQHLWLHNSKHNWIASLQHGLYHNTESYAYSRVHLNTNLSEITCVLSSEFPNPDAGFFKRHSPFQSQGITSHKCWCISWNGPRFPVTNRDVPVFYSSTLSHGQMPATDDKFLQQYISDLFQEWSLICDGFETHVTDHCNGDETSATVLVNDLADDSRYLATIQKALQDQIKGIRKVIDGYGRLHAHHIPYLYRSAEELRQLKATITDRLDKQHERVRDLRQMEFARLSVEETVFMRRISLITFIFLPLMFASQQTLFGMNVNALQSNPDWRWYIVFGAASLLLTYALWKVSDKNVRLSQMWSEIRERRAMKNKMKDCEG